MDRIIKKTASTVRLTIRDKDGNAVDATGNVTFVVKDSAGVTVSSGTATKPASTTGIYELTATPSDATAKLDVYTVEWTATLNSVAQVFVTDFEVVSRFFFGVAELRSAFSPDFDDTAKWTAEKIADAREVAEEGLTEACDVAFRPTGRRVYLDGTGSKDILVPDIEVLSVVVAKVTDGDGNVTTLTPASHLKVYPHGLLRLISSAPIGSWTSGDKNVELLYEHGLASVPARVKRAAMLWAKDVLKPRNIPDRATSWNTEEGSFDLGRPADRGPTGIPEVDAVVREFDRARPAVG